MVFGFLGDMAEGAGRIIGSIVGSIIGVSAAVVAETLGITEAMAKEAIEAGCETYEEVREFFDLD